MLTHIEGRTLHITCSSCLANHTEDVPLDAVFRFIPEFGEYENYKTTPCPTCGNVEVLNLNIPSDETEDEALTIVDLPIEEETQRYYIRLLQRMGREDWQNGG